MQLRLPDRASLAVALRDVSEGGLFIESTSPPHVGGTPRVELFPPGWTQPLLLAGTVVRAELTGFAIRLDALSDKAKAQLEQLVAQVADELSGPAVTSLAEAQQRVAELDAELRDTKDKLLRVQADAESNRAYLERALAQAGGQRRQGNSNAVVALAAAMSFFGGVVVATMISVARTAVPPAPRYDPASTRPPTVKSLEDSGPKRPVPLPMAAIFTAEAADAVDAGAPASPSPGPAPLPGPAAPPKRPASAHAAASVEAGRINCTSTAPATVLIDDEKVGVTPLKGLALKPGAYKLQFVCGDGVASPARALDVLPFSENDVEHRCP